MLRKLMVMLTLVLCLCTAAMADAADTMLTRAIKLSNRMNRTAQNEAYLTWLTDDEDVISLVGQWGNRRDNLPAFVVQTDEDEQLIKMLAWQSLAAIGGSKVYAATTMMESVDIFAGGGVGDGAYVMIYENAEPVLVIWHNEDDAVRMQAVYMPFADLADCKTVKEVGEWFEQNEIPLSFTSASVMPVTESTGKAGDDLLNRALAAAAITDAMAQDEEACIALGASESMLAVMNEWAAGDVSAPVLALRTDMAINTPGIEFLDALLPSYIEMNEALLAKAVNAAPTILLAQYCGTETLAASSMIRSEILFAHSDDPLTGLFLFVYEDHAPIMVASYAKDGAVNMRAYFLPIDALAECRSVEEANRLFDDMLLPITWEAAQ